MPATAIMGPSISARVVSIKENAHSILSSVKSFTRSQIVVFKPLVPRVQSLRSTKTFLGVYMKRIGAVVFGSYSSPFKRSFELPEEENPYKIEDPQNQGNSEHATSYDKEESDDYEMHLA